MVGDGILWGGVGERLDQVGEGKLAEGGLDCIHLQGDTQRTVASPLTPRHTPRHQGTERAAYRQCRNQARSVFPA